MTAKLGWVIVYVPDVEAAIGFYERAFGLKRRMLAPDASFGELDTGETKLSFATEELGGSHFEAGFRRPSADQPFNIEVALVFDLVTRANTALAAGDLEAVAGPARAALEICAAVGLELDEGGAEVPDAVLEVARQRDEARAAKDWARADALRDQLVADGWVVEDTPAGTQVRPA